MVGVRDRPEPVVTRTTRLFTPKTSPNEDTGVLVVHVSVTQRRRLLSRTFLPSPVRIIDQNRFYNSDRFLGPTRHLPSSTSCKVSSVSDFCRTRPQTGSKKSSFRHTHEDKDIRVTGNLQTSQRGIDEIFVQVCL